MMEKSKSRATSGLKLFLVMPAALLLFYMFACSSGPDDKKAQDTSATSPDAEVYYKVDEAAEPDGGVMAFRQYIAEHIRYPEPAKKNGVQGTVYIQFIIDENGNLVKAIENSEVPPPPPPPPDKSVAGDVPLTPPQPDPESVVMEGIVVVGYHPPEGVETEYSKEDIQLLADEAIRIIVDCDMKWKPAVKNGKPVKSAWTIPIKFLLQ